MAIIGERTMSGTKKVETSDSDKEEYLRKLEESAREVESWPEWKQDAIKGAPTPPEDNPTPPCKTIWGVTQY